MHLAAADGGLLILNFFPARIRGQAWEFQNSEQAMTSPAVTGLSYAEAMVVV